VFHRLHSKGYDDACFLYAFDLMELDGEDLRRLALVERKLRLRRLLACRKSGIVYNDHLEGEGAMIFAHACKLGMEGIVSKRRDFGYSSGRARHWIKVKNRRHLPRCGSRRGSSDGCPSMHSLRRRSMRLREPSRPPLAEGPTLGGLCKLRRRYEL
jgi:hypothetical protein